MSIERERRYAAFSAGVGCAGLGFSILDTINDLSKGLEVSTYSFVTIPLNLGIAATFSLMALAPNKDKQE